MSDFFDDLERHLDKAAHRQARWGRLASAPRPPVAAAVPVLCVAALLAIAVPQMGGTDTERDVTPAQGGPGATCATDEALRAAYPALNARPETAPPSLREVEEFPADARMLRVEGRYELWLGVRCAPEPDAQQACIGVVWDDGATARCGTRREVADGEVLVVEPEVNGLIAGLAPAMAREATIRLGRGEQASLPVEDGVFADRVGSRTGIDEYRVEFVFADGFVACDGPPETGSATPNPARPTDGAGGGPTPEPACADSSEAQGERGEPVPDGWTAYAPAPGDEGCGVPPSLVERVPALGRPPEARIPPVLRTRSDGPASFESARRALEDGGIEYWVMASLACENPDADGDRVCLIPVRPGDEEASALCATRAELEDGIEFMGFRAGGEVVVAGFAPAGAREIEALHEDRTLATLPVEGGIFGGVVPVTERRQEGELEVRAAAVSPD